MLLFLSVITEVLVQALMLNSTELQEIEDFLGALAATSTVLSWKFTR